MLTELSARTYLLARTSVFRSLPSYPVHLLLFLPGFQLRINTALECSSYSVRKSRLPTHLSDLRPPTPTSVFDSVLLPFASVSPLSSLRFHPLTPILPRPTSAPSPTPSVPNRGHLRNNPCVANSFAEVLTKCWSAPSPTPPSAPLPPLVSELTRTARS